MNWNINRIQYPIYNLGPGKRIGIWSQGCNLACKGCISQTTWNKKGGTTLSIVNVFNEICKIQSSYQGITITGGEPFQQYESLIGFLYLIKERTSLDVYCFTGYYLEQLYEMFPDLLFTKYIDFLVDGPFIEDEKNQTGLVGSKNQTIYTFKNAQPIITDSDKKNKKWSVNISEEGRIYMAGIPKKGEMNQLNTDLENHQIHKTFK